MSEMPEILFRGKRLDNGEWIEGDLLRAKYYLNDVEHCFLFTNAEVFPANEFCGYEEVDPSTVGQYTGLADKNGVKIFDGDILHVHDATIQCTKPYHEFEGYVDFLDGSYRIVCDGISHYRWIDYDVEVIGNIYDNPEMLEGGGIG